MRSSPSSWESELELKFLVSARGVDRLRPSPLSKRSTTSEMRPSALVTADAWSSTRFTASSALPIREENSTPPPSSFPFDTVNPANEPSNEPRPAAASPQTRSTIAGSACRSTLLARRRRLSTRRPWERSDTSALHPRGNMTHSSPSHRKVRDIIAFVFFHAFPLPIECLGIKSNFSDSVPKVCT